MKIYGSSLSPFVRKVLVALAELGLPHENVPTPPMSQDQEFRDTSPFGKIPGMRDGDFLLSDSSAILAYVDARKPEAGLYPTEPRARGRAVWFDEFGDTILFGCGQKLFFNRIVGPKFQNIPGNAELADKAEREELPPILDYLEGVIPPSGFLVEDRLTIADVAVASPMVNLLHLGIAIDPARHPNIVRFTDHMFARQSFATLIEKEAAFLARFS